MPVTPILNAEFLFRKAIYGAFVPLLTAYVDSAGRVKCYWKRADQLDANGQQVAPPYLIYQPQSDIAPVKWLNNVDAEGLFTIRALAPSPSAAETLLGVAVVGMANLASTGYTLSAMYERSPSIPPVDNIWTAAHIFRVALSVV